MAGLARRLPPRYRAPRTDLAPHGAGRAGEPLRLELAPEQRRVVAPLRPAVAQVGFVRTEGGELPIRGGAFREAGGAEILAHGRARQAKLATNRTDRPPLLMQAMHCRMLLAAAIGASGRPPHPVWQRWCFRWRAEGIGLDRGTEGVDMPTEDPFEGVADVLIC